MVVLKNAGQLMTTPAADLPYKQRFIGRGVSPGIVIMGKVSVIRWRYTAPAVKSFTTLSLLRVCVLNCAVKRSARSGLMIDPSLITLTCRRRSPSCLIVALDGWIEGHFHIEFQFQPSPPPPPTYIDRAWPPKPLN